MSRIEKIQNLYEKKIINLLKEQNIHISDINLIWSIILDNDSSPNKKNVRWIVETLLNDGFLWEDMLPGKDSKVYETISLFDKHKNKLSIEKRSLMNYKTLANVWNSIKNYKGELSGKELKKEEQDKAYSETEFIYKDEETGFQIVSPLSMFSAKWWGKGTRWCTSAEQGNAFLSYFLEAPLLILLMPNGDKLQLHYDGAISFMDENDENVSKQYIEEHWSILGKLIVSYKDMFFIPEQYITQEMIDSLYEENKYSIIKNIPKNKLKISYLWDDANFISHFPKEVLNDNIIKQYLKYYRYNIRYLPDEYKTYEICKLAIMEDYKNLEYIPEKYINKDIIDLYYESNVLFLNDGIECIPTEYLKQDFFINVVNNKKNSSSFYYLKNIPKHFFTKEICKKICEISSLGLRYIPEDLITKELCELAVKCDGHALSYVPEKYLTKEIYEYALIHEDTTTREKYPEYIFDQDLCNILARENYHSLEIIPNKFLNQDLCNIAIQINPWNIEHVPENFQSFEMYCQLFEKCPHTFNYMSNHDLRTKALNHYLCNMKNSTTFNENNNLVFLKKILMCYDFPLFQNFFKDIEYKDVFNEIKEMVSLPSITQSYMI